jgi:uncharacterized protein (TIGR01319 family)
MRPYLLVDFGSTYTKMTAVDLDGPAVLGTAAAPTTVDDGLINGYSQAFQELTAKTGPLKFRKKLACSSAAGGLRMAAVGLVPELTVEAAKMAALGAGARVVGVYGYELTPEEVTELSSLEPDLILLAGGTDGGNRETLIYNARQLAESRLEAPVIIAGNKNAAPEAGDLLRKAGKPCYRVPNVLPELGRLNIEPAQKAIREVFLERLVRAKGLDRVEKEIDGITMPTPAAVLAVACRLAGGDGHTPGLGELLLVDVGGATTDVHSVAEGFPTRPDVFLRGLPEPRVKRSVEGDLGLRSSAEALLEISSPAVAARLAGLSEERVRRGAEKRRRQPGYLPVEEDERRLDEALARLAVQTAVTRHAGSIEKIPTPYGISYIQTGKDLTGVKNVIGTGGILVHGLQAGTILAGALFDPAAPESLKPVSPRFFVDRRYLFSTLGLLAGEHPYEAFYLLQAAVEEVRQEKAGFPGQENSNQHTHGK